MILYALLYLARILLRSIIDKAIFFIYLVFVFKKSIEPIFYFFSSFYVKKLWNLARSILGTPKRKGARFEVLFQNTFDCFSLDFNFFSYIFDEPLKLRTLLEYLFQRNLLEIAVQLEFLGWQRSDWPVFGDCTLIKIDD